MTLVSKINIMNNKYSCKIALLILIAIFTSLTVSAQSGFWLENRDNVKNIQTDKLVKRQSFPKEFKLFNLNIEPLKNELSAIVDNKSDSTIISLPNADGDIEQFEVFEASNFEPELQAKFPEIRAFSGRGLTDRYATVKLSVTPNGVSGTVFRAASGFIETGGETEFIEPYSADRTIYAVYRSSREKGELPWVCTTKEKSLFSEWKTQIDTFEAPISNDGKIRTMRLAQSANAEYSNYFGATSSAQVSLVLAAYNATLTRANGVYERDFGLHLNLIPQSTSIIFYDPLTDPYSTTLSNWNNELRGAIIAAGITTFDYDIGHMFGASGGGGNAGCIGCVCVTGSGNAGHTKGRGITSPSDGVPAGDFFDIDYVAHEVGHQLGANHTFSYGQLPVPEMLGQDKEIGSGITIMGYAGISPVTDIAQHSIDIFHETSIAQVQANLPTKPCPAPIPNTNQTPIVNPVPNYTIPQTTPFELTGSATDPDGDPITYNWEQDDSAEDTGATAALSSANPTKLIGPNWLSFPSTSSPSKYFPRLSTILAGEFVTQPGGDPGMLSEALSSITRDLNFRLTVRDNHPYIPGSAIGQTQFRDMTVSVTNAAGPFKVTAQDSSPAADWQAGETQTITWLVANTNLPPVSTANVDILLSTDGGQTFPITLASNTPNDGTEDITVPNNATSTARIKIKAVGNVFLDINDTDFTILPSAALGIEADVAPRNQGNGAVTATDVSQIRRFAVGLDTYESSFNEFQRADSAPLATNGNGTVASTDVVQSRRFQIGLDDLVDGAGPTGPPSGFFDTVGISNYLSSPRKVRVVDTKAIGKSVEVTIEADAIGDEAIYGFSLDYNPKHLSNPRVSIGKHAIGGQVVSNTTKDGKIGILVDLMGNTMSAGNNQQLITIRFDVNGEVNLKETLLEFSNSIAFKEVSDNSANALPVNFKNGSVFLKW